MLSNECLQIYKMLINVGYKLKCLPFNMVTNGEETRMVMVCIKSDFILRKIVIHTVVCFQMFMIMLGLYYEKCFSPTANETAQFYFIAAFMFMAIQFELVTAFFTEEICELVNTLFLFCEKLRKAYLQYMEGVILIYGNLK